ncbi:Leucine-rich repeat protein SHOC-2 [Schistosoma japonicum]|nr:Leucine-rich repeat protein SHOC-2 [Schistosoma japonicum]
MMQLLPMNNQTRKLFIDTSSNHTYTISSNLFIRPNGHKHYFPVKYTNTIFKWYENTLLHLEKNKFLQWTLITISDYETSIGLKLIQWNNELITLVKHIAPILQQINLSNLKLNSLPLDVLCQFSTRLFSLNLSYNYIEMNIFHEMKSVYLWYRKQKSIDSRIKHEICWIQTINEIYLDHNKLEDQFPYEVLSYMTGLKRLYIQNNGITSLKGINGLTQLNVLRADYNKITSLHEHFFALKKIEYVYLSHNYITQPISGTRLKYLNHLKVIDLSHNGLSFLPAVIFSLPCLQILKVDHNNIYNLPTVRSNYRISKEPIQSIDLSYNQINAISDGLLRITKHLDLSKNRLRIFPAGMLKMIVNMMQLKKTKPSEIIQLDLTDNPMIWPPYSIVESGINTMIQYFLESRTEIQSYYGIKTILLGVKNCGKSSLAMSTVDRQNRMTESLEETTYSVESYTIHYDAIELTPKLNKVSQENNDSTKLKASTSRPTIITMWDCSGYMAYIPLISYFTSLSTVITILVDITKFKQTTPIDDNTQLRNPSNYFYQSVGVWLDTILYRLNYLKVILLATKCDLISSDKELNQRLKCLYNQTLNYLKVRKFWLKDQITRIESSLQISQATSKYYEHLNEIYENSYTFVYPTINSISLKQSNMIDYNQLCLTLFNVAIKTPTYIPLCLTPLPQIWSDIEMYLDDLKHDYYYSNTNSIIQLSNSTMNGCILSKYNFCHLLQNKFNLTSINLKQLLIYLNNIGKILILDAYLTKEEEKYYDVTMKSLIRPYPTLYVLINPDLFLQSLKYLLHPNLYCIIDNNNNNNNNNNVGKDFYVIETFKKDLLRHFSTVTQQSAINRLVQSCNELKRGTGIVSAYLWIALVEYSNLFVTKHNIDTGKSFVEILWRWLEFAYPVPEPDLFINFNDDSKMITSSNEMNSSIWKFKYFPSPREMAVACGIISFTEKSTGSLDNHSDTDESDNSDSHQSSTNDQIQSLLCPERLPALCFPCLIPESFCSSTDEMSNDLWNTAGQNGPRPIIFVYRFSYGLPQELFDKATVRLNWPELFNFRYTSHWKTGVQMFNSLNQIVLRFLLIKSINEDSLIKFEFRALPVTNTSSEITEVKTEHHDTNSEKNMLVNVPNHADDIPLTNTLNKCQKHKQKPKWHNWPISEENLWNIMLPILTEFDAVLLAYKGLCYKRVMECPKCNELTLAGEWLTPSEVQAVKYRKCPACAHRIPSCFIAPPASGFEC